MIIYIRDVQNLDFGQAFSNEDNCILRDVDFYIVSWVFEKANLF